MNKQTNWQTRLFVFCIAICILGLFIYPVSKNESRVQAAQTSCTIPSFNTSALNFTVGPAGHVVVADFNNDGRSDLAFTSGANAVIVSLQSDVGGFNDPRILTIDTRVNVFTGFLAVGDFNHDSNMDMAVSIEAYNEIAILLGDGTGNFAPSVFYSTPGLPISIAVADFNNDRKPDLGVASLTTSNLSILTGNGDGTFSLTSTTSTGVEPYCLTSGDFNRDGNLDIVTGNRVPDELGICTLTLFQGDGAGSMQLYSSISIETQPNAVLTNDFNGDGLLDLVVGAANANIYVYSGNGSGEFILQSAFNAGAGSATLAATDFNIDGKLDLCVANANSWEVAVLFGDGTCNFNTSISYAVNGNSDSVGIGDFNQDGRQDIVAPDPAGAGSITILSNSCMMVNTQTGSNVNIQLGQASIAFSSISSSGNTIITPAPSLPILQGGFKLNGLYYEVSTSATFSGAILLTLPYDPLTVQDPSSLRLYHFDKAINSWVDVTYAIDTVSHTVKGTSTSLSPFAVGVPANRFSGVLQPINNDGSSIFKLGRTIPVKFRLKNSSGQSVSTAIAKMFLAKIYNGIPGPEQEAVSTSASNNGNTFRYSPSDQQYIFNLETRNLSQGTWRIRVLLDDGISYTVKISLSSH